MGWSRIPGVINHKLVYKYGHMKKAYLNELKEKQVESHANSFSEE